MSYDRFRSRTEALSFADRQGTITNISRMILIRNPHFRRRVAGKYISRHNNSSRQT